MKITEGLTMDHVSRVVYGMRYEEERGYAPRPDLRWMGKTKCCGVDQTIAICDDGHKHYVCSCCGKRV